MDKKQFPTDPHLSLSSPRAQRHEIGDLVKKADEFGETLKAAKKRASAGTFHWYPYDTLSNLRTLDKLLSGDRRFLLDLASGKPILDVGCADGDLSYFFESLGYAVQAVDNPVTNFNAMRGVRALQAELGSKVEIHTMDLDAHFSLPDQEYGLVLLLGVLYHLKNPYSMLETLSKCAQYCLVSTAVTEFVPGLYEAVTATTIAYLADVYEINQDSTNYWVLSDAGFRRLLQRSNWQICDYLLTTGSGSSNPVGRIAGQRAFCLLKSKFSEEKVCVLYGPGWHALEQNSWRWTEKAFSIRVESARPVGDLMVRMKIFVPEILLARFRSVTLRAVANGTNLEPEHYGQPGQYEYSKRLLRASTGAGDVRIDFWLDHALPPDAVDQRERGIIVSWLEVCQR